MAGVSEGLSDQMSMAQGASSGGNARQAIFVAGMHRSGTSAATRVLSILGGALPEDLVSPSRNDNERGFWEGRPVVAFNNEMLDSMGSYWDDWSGVREAWLSSPVARQFVQRAGELLLSAFDNAPLIVLKDPRICRLLPIWTAAAESVGYKPLIVIPLRNPVEVAQSLQKRSNIDPSLSHLIWLRHFLDAEFHSRAFPRSVVLYETLMTDWRAWAAKIENDLDICLPRISPVAEDEISEFLSPELWHNRASDTLSVEQGSLPGWVRDSYQILRKWGRGETPTAKEKAQLDHLRATLKDMSQPFAQPLHAYRNSRKAFATLKRDHEKLTERHAETTGQLDALKAEVKAVTETLTREHDARLANEAANKTLSDKILSERDVAAAELKRVTADFDARNTSLEKELAAAKQTTSELLSQKASIEATLTAERKSRELVDAESKRIKVEFEARTARFDGGLAVLKKQIVDQQALKASLEETLHSLAAERDALSKEKALRVTAEQRAQQLEQSRAQSADTASSESLAQAKRQLDELKLQIDVEKTQRAKQEELRFREIAQLTRLTAVAQEELDRLRQVFLALVQSYSTVPVKDDLISGIRPGQRRKAELEHFQQMLVEAGAIDPDWYLANNPDIAEAGIDPVQHYILHGIKEGRAPHPMFDRA